jgi:hypothetical protein
MSTIIFREIGLEIICLVINLLSLIPSRQKGISNKENKSNKAKLTDHNRNYLFIGEFFVLLL